MHKTNTVHLSPFTPWHELLLLIGCMQILILKLATTILGLDYFPLQKNTPHLFSFFLWYLLTYSQLVAPTLFFFKNLKINIISTFWRNLTKKLAKISWRVYTRKTPKNFPISLFKNGEKKKILRSCCFFFCCCFCCCCYTSDYPNLFVRDPPTLQQRVVLYSFSGHDTCLSAARPFCKHRHHKY